MVYIKKIQVFLLLLGLLFSNIPFVYGQKPPSAIQNQSFVTRGEAIHDVVQTFDLRQQQAPFITDCIQHLDECFFVFTAMTRYNLVSLNPLRLYPDVPASYVYSDDVNLATMLSLVHGNIEEKDSPFNPRAYITRIHALKIVLGAADLLQWREKFELIRDLGNETVLRSQTTPFSDVNAIADDNWWYPRYVNFALDTGIIDTGEYFHPDEPISAEEYGVMLQRALKKSQELHASKNQPSRNSSQQTSN